MTERESACTLMDIISCSRSGVCGCASLLCLGWRGSPKGAFLAHTPYSSPCLMPPHRFEDKWRDKSTLIQSHFENMPPCNAVRWPHDRARDSACMLMEYDRVCSDLTWFSESNENHHPTKWHFKVSYSTVRWSHDRAGVRVYIDGIEIRFSVILSTQRNSPPTQSDTFKSHISQNVGFHVRQVLPVRAVLCCLSWLWSLEIFNSFHTWHLYQSNTETQ